MQSSGLSFFIDSLNLTGDLKVFYDFEASGLSVVPSVPYADPTFSGILNNPGSNFYNRSGYGLFSGNNYISIQNPELIDQTYWTMFFSYETFEPKQGILFSNYSENLGQKSGFAVGLNANNKMFFETYSNDEPFILESPFNYFNKNLTTITKYNDNISFGLYNFDEKEFNESTYYLNSDILPSNSWYLGKDINGPSYFSGGALNGYMEAFLYFSKSLSINEKNVIASGFYYNYQTGGLTITSGVYDTITGYDTIATIVGTGITGYDTTSLGFLTGDWCDCNDQDEILENTPLYGPIYEYEVVPLTGTVVEYITGVNDLILTPIDNDINTYGPRAFSYLKKIDNKDITEFLRVSGGYPNELNNIAVFDSISGMFSISPSDYQYSNVNLYSNTVAQFNSGVSGQGFFQIQNTGEFDIKYFSGGYIVTDELIFDNITGDGLFYSGSLETFTNGGPVTGLQDFNPFNSMFFYNGVKLKSGIEYRIAGNDLILTDRNIIDNFNNTIFTLPLPELYYYDSGKFTNLNVDDYKANGSMIYLNGLRQKNNIDYVELSTRSLLLGSGLFL